MNNKFEIKLSDSATKSFKTLDGSIKQLVAKQLKALETNPFKGKALGNKAGIDLTGCYKLYVYNKQIRIIYRIQNAELIIYVLEIGKRNALEVYKETFRNLDKET